MGRVRPIEGRLDDGAVAQKKQDVVEPREGVAERLAKSTKKCTRRGESRAWTNIEKEQEKE